MTDITKSMTKKQSLSDGNYPSCMTVHNGDVYVGGYYLNTDRFCPAYWINGKAYPIPTDINSQIYSISVDSNGDVYLGGSEGPGLGLLEKRRNDRHNRIRQRMHRRDVRTGRRDYNHIFRTERGRKHNCQMLHER